MSCPADKCKVEPHSYTICISDAYVTYKYLLPLCGNHSIAEIMGKLANAYNLNANELDHGIADHISKDIAKNLKAHKWTPTI